MGGECGTHAVKSHIEVTRRKNTSCKKLGVDEKIILKWILNINMSGRALDSSGLGYRPILVSYDTAMELEYLG